MIKTRPFTANDWDAFSGAEDFPGKKPPHPLISTGRLTVDGREALLIFSGAGMEIFISDEVVAAPHKEPDQPPEIWARGVGRYAGDVAAGLWVLKILPRKMEYKHIIGVGFERIN